MAKPFVRQLGQLAAAITGGIRGSAGYTPPANVIQGVDPSNWPSALQPIPPLGPKGSSPLGFPFFMGQNLAYTPRAGEEYDAETLQSLSLYPLARICIENIKDQIVQLGWSICEKKYPRKVFKRYHSRASRGTDEVAVKISRFLEYPDGEHSWDIWLRPILEDLLVIDAPSILVRRRGNGHVAELRHVPGSSIARYIDDNGFTPTPPSPAYSQLWNGTPRVNLSADQLIYRPRNIVPREGIPSSYLYGMSPTEQIASEIKIGVMRLAYVTRFYDKGSLANIIHVVPPDTPVDRIKEAMEWMNSDLAGNLEARRQWRMIQGFKGEGKDDQIIFPEEPILADIFDDLHIRKICFAYGTSPQRLQRPMNRGSAQASQEAAIEEGMKPWALWLKGTMDYIIGQVLGYPSHEMMIDAIIGIDELKQSKCDASDFANAIMSVNDLLVNRGLDPDPDPMCNVRGIRTSNGFIPLSMTKQILMAQQRQQRQQSDGDDDDPEDKNRVRPSGEGRRDDTQGPRDSDG